MLTKKDTQKAHDMLATNYAAVVVYDQAKKQTAQMQARVAIEGDPVVCQNVFSLIGGPDHGGVGALPIAQLHAGGYIVFALRPTDIRYHDFANQ